MDERKGAEKGCTIEGDVGDEEDITSADEREEKKVSPIVSAQDPVDSPIKRRAGGRMKIV